MTRADAHNNPTAFTVAIARQAGLKQHEEFTYGEVFPGVNFPAKDDEITARLIGDPLEITIRVIDQVGFYTRGSQLRWNYVAIPREVWLNLSPIFKAGVISGMYNREGGIEMRNLFPRSFIF